MAFGALGQFGTAEDVEAVDGMEHHILVEHVRPGIGARQRGERTRDLALLTEQVEGLQAQGEGFVFEHRLRDRGVPLQFVGVEFGRREPAARGHAQVGGEGHAPGQGEVGRGAVGEAPRVEVGGGEQRGVGVLVGHASVEGEVPPRTAVGKIEALGEGSDGGAAFVGHDAGKEGVHLTQRGRIGQGGGGGRRGHVAHRTGEVGIGRGGEVEHLLAVEGRVEGQAGGGVPVAVDVFGAGESATRHVIVDGELRDAAGGQVEVGVRHESLQAFGVVGVVVEVHAVVPHGAQAGVAHRDAEGVGVVDHADELRHRGLRGASAVVEIEVGGFRERVAEAHIGGEVEDVAHGVDAADGGALVLQAGAFGRELHAGREAHGAHVVAQAHLHAVVVVAVGGVL